MKLQRRAKNCGEIWGILIIVLAIIGGGFWALHAYKKKTERDGKLFAEEAITRLAVHYDNAYFAAQLGREARLEYPPARQANFLLKFRELGLPLQPIPIEGSVTFKSGFFEPFGLFRGKLQYPSRPGEIEIGVSHPANRWQIDTIDIKWERER